MEASLLGNAVDPRVAQVLRKVREIEIRTHRLVDETFAGQYRSVFRGRGIDFETVREYVPGDEVRSIDWNVTARAGRPFVKEFTEERELQLVLLVDVSASGEFGSTAQTKRELAAEVASVLAFSAIRNGDKVGAILFSDRVEKFVPPKKGRGHVLQVISEILTCEPEGEGTDIAAALDFAGSVSRRRSVTFLISDFQTNGERAPAIERLRHAMTRTSLRHDLIALRVRDRREEELPDVGTIVLEDAETGELVELDTSRRRVRDAFGAQAVRRRAELEELFRRARVESLEIETGGSYVPALVGFFRSRQRRPR
ncbi:MAG: DUF58 domain-containing protein [Myxococcota bacterium]|nr:DUF58 domain-containing protein [Myxococcota bacterium]